MRSKCYRDGGDGDTHSIHSDTRRVGVVIKGGRCY